PFADHQTKDARGRCTQRHSHSNLRRSLAHRSSEHAIQTHARKQHCNHRENSNQQERKTCLCLGLDHQRVHRLHLIDERLLALLANYLAHGTCKRRRISVSPERPPVSSPVVHISIGDVQLFAAGLDQRCVALMGHHTDDLSPLSLIRANAKQDPLADSRLVWKCLRRECLIDYQEIAIRLAVVLGKGPSREKCRAHRFEVARQDDLKIGSLKLARIVLSFRSAPTHRTKPAAEWQWIRRGHTAYARERAELVMQLSLEVR